LDVSHKRLARTESANHARGVIEAQYQDAVRLEIDKLYVAFLEVVAARETLRFARANVDGLGRTMRIAKIQLDNQQIAPLDLDRLGLQMDAAELGVEQATISLRETKHSLGLLLAMPIEEAERTELRGAFRDTAPPPPNERELFTLALSIRPDLNAYRLGVQRAESDVRLAEAERVSDLFLLYSPFELRNNGPTGGQNATSWSLAAFSSVPLFNRNQGNIRRAQVNVSQTRTELTGLEQEIVEETHHAYTEYLASRNVVDRLEKTVLPRSRRIRDTVANLLNQGQASTLEFLSAQREHNDVVRQYRDALIRHRRSMLKLNTALGERLLP
jgi:cobalt-zinc-cadmium efflux system outer membrane protein